MFVRRARMVGAITIASLAVAVLAPAVSASAGPGTFTRITTPSATTYYHFNGASGASNTLSVSGQTSFDVSAVDIDCIYRSAFGGSPVVVQSFASSVPVTGGAFGTTANLATFPRNCRMRAVPTSVDPMTDYLGSYAGPILYASMIQVDKDGAVPFAFTAAGEEGDGLGVVEDAARCGISVLSTVQTPGMQVEGPADAQCAFFLPAGTVADTTTPRSSIRVDGHNAYLPAVVKSFLRGGGLPVTQSALTTSLTRATNGDVTVTESAPLMRCSGNNTFPPTTASCPSLSATGVTFKRVTNIFRSGHQVRLRDTFSSTDGVSHDVSTVYVADLVAPPTGAKGYSFPGHGTRFAVTSSDQVVGGLGTKAGTLFVRSDIDSFEGDQSADTIGLTWSRAPSDVEFAHVSSNLFQMPFSLHVPAGGSAYLGFAESEAPSTSDARSRASVATNEMVSKPVITSPADHASIAGTSTTVKGTVALGANGLPTSVTVNGHAAHLTVNGGRTAVSYSVTFSEALGTHTIKVTATDLAGNTRAKSITVTNH
jgi:hypothetical protein